MPQNFPVDDLESVAERLQQADFLVPGYRPPAVGIYHPAVYFNAKQKGTKTIIFPDRNVASRIAQLAQKRKSDGDRQLCLCAGLLAYAHLMDIQFQPGLAFHELAHLQGNEAAHEELAWFKAADNAPPQDMLNVALGRTNGVSRDYQPLTVSPLDLAFPLKRWNRNYIVALKILELDYAEVSSVDKALRLLDWMTQSFIFAGPALVLAVIYLGNRSPSRKGVFKSKGSADRSAALAGVRNAAWDITHLSEFIRFVNESAGITDKHYLFASFDTHLMLMARFVMQVSINGTDLPTLEKGLSTWWVEKDAAQIAHSIIERLRRVQSADHVPMSSTDPNFIPKMIAEGEQRVIDLV